MFPEKNLTKLLQLSFITVAFMIITQNQFKNIYIEEGIYIEECKVSKVRPFDSDLDGFL